MDLDKTYILKYFILQIKLFGYSANNIYGSGIKYITLLSHQMYSSPLHVLLLCSDVVLCNVCFAFISTEKLFLISS